MGIAIGASGALTAWMIHYSQRQGGLCSLARRLPQSMLVGAKREQA